MEDVLYYREGGDRGLKWWLAGVVGFATVVFAIIVMSVIKNRAEHREWTRPAVTAPAPAPATTPMTPASQATEQPAP